MYMVQLTAHGNRVIPEIVQSYYSSSSQYYSEEQLMEISSNTTSPAHVSTLEEKLKNLKFPKFHHEKHKPIVNVNEVADGSLTFSDRTSDSVAAYVGSWRFVILMTGLLIVWLIWNSIPFLPHFDPAPFILLNLCLSFLAGYTAPFIMMSQNRQASKDRLTAENDYKTDVKGEEEIRHILEHLDHQDGLILQIAQRLEVQNQRIDQQEQLILQIVQKMDSQQQFMKEQHQEILRLLNAPSEEGQG
jgi:uncharacterized membrane protein